LNKGKIDAKSKPHIFVFISGRYRTISGRIGKYFGQTLTPLEKLSGYMMMMMRGVVIIEIRIKD
jgi:hypothetical protein